MCFSASKIVQCLHSNAYGAQERVIEPLLAKGKQVFIPSRRGRNESREHDRHVYKEQHLIENFFARLKQY